jgi:hypothetical protein
MEVGLVLATVGLVAATLALVYYTRGLVQEATAARAEAERSRQEMEEARHLSVRPRLAFDPMGLNGKFGGVLLIRNVGRGPALDVDLAITFEGVGERREWSEASIVPDECHELNLPEPFRRNLDATLEQPLELHVEGRMEDLYGRRIDVEARFDISAWWTKIVAAGERIAGRKKVPTNPFGQLSDTTESAGP